MSIRILVVDDNVDIINNVREYLSLKGWTVEWCTTGSDALRRLQADPFDLLILDLGLPGLDGLTICRELRAAHSKLPILMLTGRDAIDDRVRGFEAGTDDYLVKPFSLRELAARVEALLRRSYGASEKVLRVGDLEMNLETMRVTRAGRDIRLHPLGLRLLKILMSQSPAIVGRARLETLLWNGSAPDSDSLRSNLYRLRQEVDKPFDKALIHTHPGLVQRSSNNAIY